MAPEITTKKRVFWSPASNSTWPAGLVVRRPTAAMRSICAGVKVGKVWATRSMDASEGFEPKLVDEAPTPALPRLERADDRVLRLVEVLRGVAVPRIVTAPDVPARH